jgi:predicted NBD/HSP70 family sugar kinase
MPIYAAVEGGGTTWRVALADGHPSNIIESEVYETIDDPVEQLRIIREWLDKRKFDALGVATFGPIDPRPGSSTYGYITTTPKPGWANVDVVGALSDGAVPVQFDTDVNAPALAEYMVSKQNYNNMLLSPQCTAYLVGFTSACDLFSIDHSAVWYVAILMHLSYAPSLNCSW